MTYILLDRLTNKYEESVWKLLKNSDHECVPSLSENELHARFEQMKQQAFILAEEGGKIVGFLAYIPEKQLSFPSDTFCCEYASTIIVDPDYRYRGIAKNMYEVLSEFHPMATIVTHTWPENEAHLKILEELNFKLIDTIKNDHKKGIDILYYKKECWLSS